MSATQKEIDWGIANAPPTLWLCVCGHEEADHTAVYWWGLKGQGLPHEQRACAVYACDCPRFCDERYPFIVVDIGAYDDDQARL